MKEKAIRIKITPGYINKLNSKSEEYLDWDFDCSG